MHYYIYRITNLINGKIYVGAHRTLNKHDKYMGSGQAIKAAIAKHGSQNFKKEILEEFQTESEMYQREREIVNEEFVKREDTYNLCVGGLGQYGGMAFAERLKTDEEFAKQWSERIRMEHQNGKIGSFRDKEHHRICVDKSHSEEAETKRKETFKKMKHQQGSSNSQYGKRFQWITDGNVNKKFEMGSPIPEGWNRGKVQKKRKPS